MELKGIKLKGAYKIEFYDKSLEVYDEKGNLIYCEEKNGYWGKWEYDEKGNQTYYETSDGYWQKRKYDKKGNEIYYESSENHWSEREYDKKGNLIYYKNSNSVIIDERIRELTIKQIENLLGYKIKIIKWLKTERSFLPRNENVFFLDESVFILTLKNINNNWNKVPTFIGIVIKCKRFLFKCKHFQ